MFSEPSLKEQSFELGFFVGCVWWGNGEFRDARRRNGVELALNGENCVRNGGKIYVNGSENE